MANRSVTSSSHGPPACLGRRVAAGVAQRPPGAPVRPGQEGRARGREVGPGGGLGAWGSRARRRRVAQRLQLDGGVVGRRQRVGQAVRLARLGETALQLQGVA
jgi:hypothetical protein